MPAQTSDPSQDRIENDDAIDAVPLADDTEEKPDAEEGPQPSPEWSIDSKNPINWSATRKWSIVILLWAMVTVTSASLPLYTWLGI